MPPPHTKRKYRSDSSCEGSQLKIFEVGFYYPGTLIYFDKDLSKLEDLDYLDDFTW